MKLDLFLSRALALIGCCCCCHSWTEAMQMMKEGAKWELYIPRYVFWMPLLFLTACVVFMLASALIFNSFYPSELAYGDRGAGGTCASLVVDSY